MNETDVLDKKFQKELNSGITALILLSVLKKAREPMYGYQIAKLIEVEREGKTIMKQGVLYPALRSLESSGLLASKVEPSVFGPPRRYYWITDDGRAAFERWKEIWNQIQSFVEDSLGGKNHD